MLRQIGKPDLICQWQLLVVEIGEMVGGGGDVVGLRVAGPLACVPLAAHPQE